MDVKKESIPEDTKVEVRVEDTKVEVRVEEPQVVKDEPVEVSSSSVAIAMEIPKELPEVT